MTIFSNNETPSLLFAEQGSAPTTPAAGFWRAYTKSDGFYVVDDAGTEYGPFDASATAGGAESVTTNAASGTDTITLGEEFTRQRYTDASLVTITLDTNANEAFTAGQWVDILAWGAGGVEVAGASGVTVNGTAGTTAAVTLGQYEDARLIYLGSDLWAALTGGSETFVEYADTINALGNVTGTVTPDPADGMWVTATLTGNITIDLTNLTVGQTLVFDLTQDGTGSRTVGFTQTVEWPGGTAFSHTGTASSRDRITVDYDGTTYTGHTVGQNYS